MEKFWISSKGKYAVYLLIKKRDNFSIKENNANPNIKYIFILTTKHHNPPPQSFLQERSLKGKKKKKKEASST